MAVTFGDIAIRALRIIGVLAEGEPLPSAQGTAALAAVNALLDEWNARRLYIYNVNFTQFILTANHQPHTIGLSTNSPAPDFSVPGNRPVYIEAASIVLTNVTPNVTNPLNIRDDDWWANQRVKTLTSGLPTDLYYSPDFPNGSLYLWPVSTTAWKIELEMRNLLTSVADLTVSFILPPAYQNAITFTLAENLSLEYPEATVSPLLIRNAAAARAAVQSANSQSPGISTRDFGMPNKGSKNRTNWNYRSGLVDR